MPVRHRARSVISGSCAAFSITVSPLASVAAISAFSVAPTDTMGKAMRPPVSPFFAVAVTKRCPILISAPSASIAFRCRSIGRAPIWQPPGSGTRASPQRASSGPSVSMDARIFLLMSAGASVEVIRPAFSVMTRPNTSGRLPSISVETPNWLTRCPNMSTSARRGRLRSVSGSSVRSAAGMSVSAAFLAPDIWMRPSSGRPPRMMILSISS